VWKLVIRKYKFASKGFKLTEKNKEYRFLQLFLEHHLAVSQQMVLQASFQDHRKNSSLITLAFYRYCIFNP